MTKEEKTTKVATISSAIGGLFFVSGLAFGLYEKKKFWPVAGYSVGFGLIGLIGSSSIANIAIKIPKNTDNSTTENTSFSAENKTTFNCSGCQKYHNMSDKEIGCYMKSGYHWDANLKQCVPNSLKNKNTLY